MRTNSENILEIGVGNKTVSDYLKRRGLKVTTCDYDRRLSPDVVADVRKLPFDANFFDLIYACEVLEHIPFDDFKNVLKDLHRITKRYVIISVPYPRMYFGASFRFPFIKRILRKESIEVNLGIDIPTKIVAGEHFWEIGRKEYPLRRIRKELRKHFRIVKEKRGLPHPVHYFFMLEKRRPS
ncbi:class I SAM-dependent methyltransferase [Candidatus Woesearchaeota archaeon]|nr:class I SAM-dependent methyltransferase [Candidatus Woesearchaeota archaeon]MBW3021838.1 class I SAM-dependent methyltransferase [Candidatus Woesearchaeota archaeon]